MKTFGGKLKMKSYVEFILNSLATHKFLFALSSDLPKQQLSVWSCTGKFLHGSSGVWPIHGIIVAQPEEQTRGPDQFLWTLTEQCGDSSWFYQAGNDSVPWSSQSSGNPVAPALSSFPGPCPSAIPSPEWQHPGHHFTRQMGFSFSVSTANVILVSAEVKWEAESGMQPSQEENKQEPSQNPEQPSSLLPTIPESQLGWASLGLFLCLTAGLQPRNHLEVKAGALCNPEEQKCDL